MKKLLMLFSYIEFQIHTGQTLNEVCDNLHRLIDGQKYIGTISKSGFTFCSKPDFFVRRANFNVKGKFETTENEVIIHGTMRENLVAILIKIIWLLGMLCCTILVGVFTEGEVAPFIMCLCILGFGYLLFYSAFLMEKSKIKDLQKLFEKTGNYLVDRKIKWHFKSDHNIYVKKRYRKIVILLCMAIGLTVTIPSLILELYKDYKGDGLTLLLHQESGFSFSNLDVEVVLGYLTVSIVVLLCFLLSVFLIIYVVRDCKAYIRFDADKIEYFDGIKKFNIYYRELDRVQYAYRWYRLSPVKQGVVNCEKEFHSALNKIYPFYEFINCSESVMCFLHLRMMPFSKKDLEQKLLYYGISINGKNGPVEKKCQRLKGVELEQLQSKAVRKILGFNLKKYLDFYNKKAVNWNKIIGKISSESKPIMELEDMYEAGLLYWKTDVCDEGVYFDNSEMKRVALENFVTIGKPKRNSVVFCIRNCDKEVMLLWELDDE